MVELGLGIAIRYDVSGNLSDPVRCLPSLNSCESTKKHIICKTDELRN